MNPMNVLFPLLRYVSPTWKMRKMTLAGRPVGLQGSMEDHWNLQPIIRVMDIRDYDEDKQGQGARVVLIFKDWVT